MTITSFKSRPQGTSISDLFEDLFFTGHPLLDRRGAVPAVNIHEDKDQYEIEFLAPGYNKEDFKISIEKDILVISAEKKEEAEKQERNYRKREFSVSSLKRSFSLPKHVELDKIAASYESGILSVKIPKLETQKEKPAIEIKIS